MVKIDTKKMPDTVVYIFNEDLEIAIDTITGAVASRWSLEEHNRWIILGFIKPNRESAKTLLKKVLEEYKLMWMCQDTYKIFAKVNEDEEIYIAWNKTMQNDLSQESLA